LQGALQTALADRVALVVGGAQFRDVLGGGGTDLADDHLDRPGDVRGVHGGAVGGQDAAALPPGVGARQGLAGAEGRVQRGGAEVDLPLSVDASQRQFALVGPLPGVAEGQGGGERGGGRVAVHHGLARGHLDRLHAQVLGDRGVEGGGVPRDGQPVQGRVVAGAPGGHVLGHGVLGVGTGGQVPVDASADEGHDQDRGQDGQERAAPGPPRPAPAAVLVRGVVRVVGRVPAAVPGVVTAAGVGVEVVFGAGPLLGGAAAEFRCVPGPLAGVVPAVVLGRVGAARGVVPAAGGGIVVEVARRSVPTA